MHYIKFFYNPEVREHQKILAYLETQGEEIVKIDLMKEPITPMRLGELAQELGCAPFDMIDKNSEKYLAEYSQSELTDMDWLKVMAHNHEMIHLPIVVKGDKAVFLDKKYDAVHLNDLF